MRVAPVAQFALLARSPAQGSLFLCPCTLPRLAHTAFRGARGARGSLLWPSVSLLTPSCSAHATE
eukprot:scaffold5597_cov105-Isochrysis_galbana.AAC.3